MGIWRERVVISRLSLVFSAPSTSALVSLFGARLAARGKDDPSRTEISWSPGDPHRNTTQKVEPIDAAGGRMTFEATNHRPTLMWVLLKMFVAALRRPRLVPHLVAALRGFAVTRWRSRRAVADRRPITMIAMIEHLGDIIAAEPVARYAARQHLGDRVTWICRATYEEAVVNFRAVDGIVTVGCMTEWLLLWATERPEHRIWDLHLSGRSCPRCGIGFRKPGGAGRITYDTYYNIGNLLQVNCLAANLPVLDETPQFLPSPRTRTLVDRLRLPERFVVIHCASNDERRDWQTQKWHDLVGWLTEQAGLEVCEVGINAVAVPENADRWRNLCGRLSIVETAEVIARATLFIGVDSGPAHLANAAETPGVVLLGCYHVFPRYTPFSGGYGDGSLAELVRTTGFARAIPVEAVIAAVSRRLGRSVSPQRTGDPVERL